MVMTLLVTVILVVMMAVVVMAGNVQMAVAYLQATIVMVPLNTAMPDGDLTVQMALMKY